MGWARQALDAHDAKEAEHSEELRGWEVKVDALPACGAAQGVVSGSGRRYERTQRIPERSCVQSCAARLC